MDKMILKAKIVDIAVRFKREVLDQYEKFPVNSSERKLIEELSKIFLYKELKLDIENKKSGELEKEAKPFIEKLGLGSALLTRLMVSYIDHEAKKLSFSTDEIKKRCADYKIKIEQKISGISMRKPPEEFLKEFFLDTKKSSKDDIEYYKNYYAYYYYYALTKFMNFISA